MSASPQIVVVDDNEYLVELLEERFRSEKWKTHGFTDEGGAVHHLERETVDIVLLDVQLGTSDGFEVLEKIRADRFTKDVPVIMLTCRNGSADVQRAKELGASGYIVKPFDIEKLVSRVSRELDRDQAFLL